MNLETLKDNLMKAYEDNNQTLKLVSWINEEECRKYGGFTEQEFDVVLGEKSQASFIFIQNYSNISPEDWDILGSLPYCKTEKDVIKVTVPKFGELSKEDIAKAIKYVIRNYLKSWLIFNVEIDGERLLW